MVDAGWPSRCSSLWDMQPAARVAPRPIDLELKTARPASPAALPRRGQRGPPANRLHGTTASSLFHPAKGQIIVPIAAQMAGSCGSRLWTAAPAVDASRNLPHVMPANRVD